MAGSNHNGGEAGKTTRGQGTARINAARTSAQQPVPARGQGLCLLSPADFAAPLASRRTCVRRMSATRNINLRIPSRRAMMAESEMKMERERCLGWEMRLQKRSHGLVGRTQG